MKPSVSIAVIGVGLCIASAGVLYPLHGSIASVGSEKESLEAEIVRDGGVHEVLMATHEEFTSLQKRIRERAYRLCPNTSEAEHEFENSLQDAVGMSGLASVRMDRRNEQMEAGHPCLIIDLAVDGDAAALQRFLVELEQLPWVTRVLSLAIEAGAETRRIQIQVAVMLERAS
ncbi:MAG: hypothetical protein ACYTG2_02185 [Planctomycetota bacterium]|jgi:hypothetical protein